MASNRLVATIVIAVVCVALADEAFEWRKNAWSCSSTSQHREACVGEIGGAGIAAERALKLLSSDELGESTRATEACDYHPGLAAGATAAPTAATPFVKMFDGECGGGEIRMYEGNGLGDNPGTKEQQAARCSEACLSKKEALSGSWSGFTAMGFVVSTTGRCYCESTDSKTCKKSINYNWVRYDWVRAKSWMEPYRKAVLDSSLRNIMHNGVRVDCNPASCDNPRVCGIPPCRGVLHTPEHPHPDYMKSVTKKTCPAEGCGIQTTAVSSDMPSKPKWAYLVMTQPASRVGLILPPAYTAGFVSCYPGFAKTDRKGYAGSWMTPGAGNCNRYELMACNKGAIAHTALSPQRDNSHRHAALLFVKRTWCIKGECDSSDCPVQCYTYKRGQCLKFHRPVMSTYASDATKLDSRKAYKELVAGRFSTKCTPEAARAARAMLAGN